MPTPDNQTPAPRWARFLVLALALVTIFFQLGTRALNEPDEGRYAEVGREMMDSGDWLMPRLNGIPHLSKPPLTYWCVAACLRVFGVNEFAARLPAALAALGTLLALYLMVRRAADELTALWAVVMLTSSAMFFLIARLITADMLLTCWVTWSVWALWRWYHSDNRSWRTIVWFYVFLGLGMLTKGPVAVALPLFALVGLRWRDPSLRLRQMHWIKGILTLLAICAPWFVALALQNPELWEYFLVREVFQRVATGEHGRSKEWWFFIPILFGSALPWTLLVFGRLKLTAGTRMFAAWAILGLVLFSISQSKLPTYILPLMPPLAALAAMAQPRRWLNALTAVALAAALILVAYYLRSRCGLPEQWVITLNVMAIGGALAALVAALANRTALFRGIAVGTFLATVCAAVALIPLIERQLRHNTSVKFLAERIRREDPHRKSLIVCHVWLPRGLPFYLQDRVWWYYPQASQTRGKVFELDHPAPGTPFVVTDATRYREMLTGAKRVFCIATTGDAEKMPELTGMTWHTLERTGQGVLLSNQP